MFFADRIKSIQEGERVLEIGPGATPFHRSDVLLEMEFGDENEYAAQFGHGEKLKTDKKLVFYKGDVFPFGDKEFDYVICSHVLEHVENVPGFLQEVFRVGKKGYFEYPLIYYEYLYNFDVHLNLLRFKNGTMNYMPKSKSQLNEFRPVQNFFYESLQKAHVQIINDLLEQMMEGFEWHQPFPCREVSDIADLTIEPGLIPNLAGRTVPTVENNESLRELIKKVIKKVL
jgi:ubiquinone/menaquinone biosynthesis C-methylase UbiE